MKHLFLLMFFSLIFTSIKTFAFESHYEKALIIIDMQDYFETSHPKDLRENIKESIRNAAYYNDLIIFVEYELSCVNMGKTTDELTSLVPEGYPHQVVVKKSQDGGGDKIVAFLKKEKIQIDTVEIAGVNGCACVEGTIYDLRRENPDFNLLALVHEIGCYCRKNSYKDHHQYNFRYPQMQAPVIYVEDADKESYFRD